MEDEVGPVTHGRIGRYPQDGAALRIGGVDVGVGHGDETEGVGGDTLGHERPRTARYGLIALAQFIFISSAGFKTVQTNVLDAAAQLVLRGGGQFHRHRHPGFRTLGTIAQLALDRFFSVDQADDRAVGRGSSHKRVGQQGGSFFRRGAGAFDVRSALGGGVLHTEEGSAPQQQRQGCGKKSSHDTLGMR